MRGWPAAAWLLAWPAAVAAAPGSPADRDAINQALAVLPAALRRGIEVAVSDRVGDRPCPAPPDEAAVSDGRISVCEGPSVRRQVLFAVFARLDEQYGWSRQEGWRRLNGWARSPLPPWRWQARNQAPGAFATATGQRSPALDLASFAAAWLDGDPDLGCRLMPQARFLQARLRELGTTAVPPLSCPAFEAWARRDRLAHIELTLATPSTVTMASMFGHVFLRLVDRAPEGEPPALEDRTVAFLVETAIPVTEEPFYAVKGITGAYQASLVERSFLETYRTYVVAEGRDLRRFRLNLTAAETDALLERIWSLRQAGRYRYYFFAANCATLMVDLINDVLPRERRVHYPEALATTPAGTLEGYASTTAADGGPLATFIPDTILSFEHQARVAAAERAQLAARLATADARFAPAWRAIRGGEDGLRAAAYERLPAVVPPSGELQRFLRASAIIEAHLSTLANLQTEEVAERQRRRRVQATLAATVGRVAAGTGAFAAVDGACAAAATGAVRLATDGELAARLRGYRALEAALDGPCREAATGSDELRRVALLAIAARHDGDAIDPTLHDRLLFPEPELLLGQQRFAVGLAPLIDHPYVTRVAAPVLAIQRAQRALAATATPADPDRLRQEDQAARGQAEAAVYAAGLPRTGVDELEVGSAVGWRAPRPLLVLGGALHDEQLGDQRRFGFPPHTALTILRTRTALGWEDGRPVVSDWQARALAYRSLSPRLEVGSWRPPLGGEVALDVSGRSAGRALALRLTGGGLLPLAAGSRLADHLLLGVGPVAGADWGRPATAVAMAGGAVALEGRLAFTRLRGAWLGARAEARPLWTTAGPAREILAGADLRLPLVQATTLPWNTTPSALVLRLAARLESSTLPLTPRLDGRGALTLAVE